MEELQISCVEIRRELSNYFEGDVSSEVRARIELHIEACNGCRAVFDGMKNVIRLVESQEVLELPLGFSRRLYERLRARTVC